MLVQFIPGEKWSIDWCDFLNNSESDISTSDLENYLHFFGIDQLIQLWDIAFSEKGLRNFVLFFYYYGNQVLDLKLLLNHQNAASAVKSLVYVDQIISLLETAYFNSAEVDKAYAEKVSIVLQMIEQQLKVERDTLISHP